ncbi:MAG: LysR family transcriptional regulator, partial [Alphaproteobacteria bacterium]|nr:LysR family transcriptional regulator [Alphaproteobacteria bacterium]
PQLPMVAPAPTPRLGARPSHANMKFLRTFLTLVEERSTAKTAKRLGTAQTNVMNHVVKIEMIVGARLLERNFPPNREEQGRTQLTEAGRQFLPKAIAAMRAHDRLFDDEPVGNDPREASRAIALRFLETALSALRHDLTDDELNRLYSTLSD